VSVTGPEDGDPVKVGLPMTDLITAMWAAFGVVGSLFRREFTGGGDRIEISMHDAALPWLTKQAGKAFVDEEPERMGTKDPVLAPYQTYPTADGYLNVACANQKLWAELCEAVDRPDLVDDDRFASNPDRVSNMDDLEVELSAVFRERSTDEWVELLAEDHGLPVGPVYDVPAALDSEQTEAREVIQEVDHPAVGTVPVIEHPLNYEHAEAGFEGPPPLLGEDTEAILRELGYDDEALASLRADGAIPEE
jgi:crotonobetainyl-CoA:carnitine CoA-transferase CaiB-like acyl-CoA transferase